jgi:uroporphyrinogen-III synthase
VGRTTAEAARRAGFHDVRVGPGSGEDLARRLAAEARPGARWLYLAGRDRTPGLESVLAASGFRPEVVEVYAAEPVVTLSPAAAEVLQDTGPVAVLHFSQRSAACFLALLEALGPGVATRRGLVHCCLSEAVARPLVERGLDALVAATPEADSLLRLLPGRTPRGQALPG